MYIRNRQEALDVLAEVLESPSRTDQIIKLTVKIVLCLDPDARLFLADCQAGLIEGGLEEMRRKRQEMKSDPAKSDIILIIDPEEDHLFEEIASTHDALRIVEILLEVFPALTKKYPTWVLARAVLQNEKKVQELIKVAIQARREESATDLHMTATKQMHDILESAKPEWTDKTGTMRQACLDTVQAAALAPKEEADTHGNFLFTCITSHDPHAETVLNWIDKNDPHSVINFVRKLSELADALYKMESGTYTAVKKKTTA